MDFEPYRYNSAQQPVQPPNVFFDGTRLGLEGNMLATLIIAIPAGLHIALSVILGYAVRYAVGLPDQAKPFTLFGLLFAFILALISLCMLLFFIGAIPTMGYSMALVAVMMRWFSKFRGREKWVSTITGAIMGLLTGAIESAVVLLLMDLAPTWSAYTTLFRWPAVMSIDAIALLWLTLNLPVNAGAGAQIGWRLGKQLEELAMRWFW